MKDKKILNKQELKELAELGYEFAMVARRDGLLQLEMLIGDQENELVKEGLDMCASGMSIENMIEQLKAFQENELFEFRETLIKFTNIFAPLLFVTSLAEYYFSTHGFVSAFEVLCGVWFSSGVYRDYMYKSMEITLVTEIVVGLVAGDNPRGLRSKLLNLIGLGE